jgi:hypothetical protein
VLKPPAAKLGVDMLSRSGSRSTTEMLTCPHHGVKRENLSVVGC